MIRERKDWDSYFLDIAAQVATRATCDRKHVGCVLVRERQIIATGYNGSAPGGLHCDDAGHLMVDGSCQRTIHAEANAIAQAARNGNAVAGATAYVTAFPCLKCFLLLASVGIEVIVAAEKYRDWPVKLVDLYSDPTKAKRPQLFLGPNACEGYER